MPTARSLIAGLTLALTAISCTDKGPTEANNTTDNQTPSAPTAPKIGKQPLIFQGGQTFNGVAYTNTVQVTSFEYRGDQLFVNGQIIWKDPTGTVVNTQTFEDWPATLTSSGSPTAAVCNILILDIGTIHLDLLGLNVDLAPVHLAITAVSGAGNLLGNLLCALTHLLDQPSPLLTAITNLINQINALLAGL
jgi:hypothetical protein